MSSVPPVPAVEIAGVTRTFGEHRALAGIDLAIGEHEFLSLLGPSGCGKTTLLRIIAGFERPDTGRVRIRGADVTDLPPDRRPTNIVFQRGALFPHMNVAENIGYSLRLKGWPKARIAAKVEELLALVRLDGLGGRGPTELSGGQVQRAALARALAAEPSVLLLDEPLSALDLKLRQHMQLELRAIQRSLGATFIYVTHDQTEALVMSDRIAVMDRGRIVQLGTPREIYARPATVFASDFVGETNLLRGTATGTDGAAITVSMGAVGTIAAYAVDAIAPGDPVTVSVRPGSIRVRPAAVGPAGDGEPAGTVHTLVYLGDRTRAGVSLADGSSVWADLRDGDEERIADGTSVVLSWAADAARAWRGHETVEG